MGRMSEEGVVWIWDSGEDEWGREEGVVWIWDSGEDEWGCGGGSSMDLGQWGG